MGELSWMNIWAASWQNQQNGMCAQRRLGSWKMICPVWSVFAVRMKKAWVLSYAMSAQRKLIRLGGCPGWSESLLGAPSFCLFCHVAVHIFLWVGWLCWGLTSQSTIFQSYRDGAIASWVINQYFRGVKCLAQGSSCGRYTQLLASPVTTF